MQARFFNLKARVLTLTAFAALIVVPLAEAGSRRP